jgi:hypothetical protein
MPAMPLHPTLRGSIRYARNKKTVRVGQERGREHFIITPQSDGVRVVHTHCETDVNQTSLER